MRPRNPDTLCMVRLNGTATVCDRINQLKDNPNANFCHRVTKPYPNMVNHKSDCL